MMDEVHEEEEFAVEGPFGFKCRPLTRDWKSL